MLYNQWQLVTSHRGRGSLSLQARLLAHGKGSSIRKINVSVYNSTKTKHIIITLSPENPAWPGNFVIPSCICQLAVEIPSVDNAPVTSFHFSRFAYDNCLPLPEAEGILPQHECGFHARFRPRASRSSPVTIIFYLYFLFAFDAPAPQCPVP